MKDIDLILEGVKAISDDKIIDAIAFSLRAEAISRFFISAIISACFGYALYRFVKVLTR